MIQLYWDIGKIIVERQKMFGWGKKIVEKLAHDLLKDFAGQSGFSTQNLWYMRQFFLTYKNSPNLQRFVGELPWGQNLEIMANAKPWPKRSFTFEKPFGKDEYEMYSFSHSFHSFIIVIFFSSCTHPISLFLIVLACRF